jgi:hypothetical protein
MAELQEEVAEAMQGELQELELQEDLLRDNRAALDLLDQL